MSLILVKVNEPLIIALMRWLNTIIDSKVESAAVINMLHWAETRRAATEPN